MERLASMPMPTAASCDGSLERESQVDHDLQRDRRDASAPSVIIW